MRDEKEGEEMAKYVCPRILVSEVESGETLKQSIQACKNFYGFHRTWIYRRK